MTSRVSSSVEGIEPSVRDRAEAAARRAGLSLNDWLNSTIGNPAIPAQPPAEVAEIHHRLDSISRQIEQMAHSGAPRPQGLGVAGQLNDALSRLDVRLSQLSATPPGPVPPPARPAAPSPAPAWATMPTEPVRHTTLPELLQFDIAEIRARQTELNAPPRLMQAAAAPPIAPQAPVPDLSGFERQLQYLTSQIEGLRRPDVDQAIAGFRVELAEMRQAITEALPRRALESLETEIRAVARRIDESRQNGGDGEALHAVEQALREIHVTLRTLTPAEQLAGFDDAIRNLGGKIDMIVRTSADGGALQQIEGTLGALRGIVSNVASNEALARLAEDVRMLGAKVDQLAPDREFAGSLVALEQRIAQLTSNLESRDRPGEDGAPLEQAVRALSDRIDHLQVGNDASAAFAHVEQRVLQLLERLELADSRMANVGRVEDGLSDILRHLEQQRLSLATLSEFRAPPLAPAPMPGMDPEVVDALRRELSDLKLSSTETGRNTQDALESVHNTLGHVVDRLAMIEGDLRDSRAARGASITWPSAQDMAPTPAPPAMQAPLISTTATAAPTPAARREPPAAAPVPRPELPNPVAAALTLPTAPMVAPAGTPAMKEILVSANPDAAAAAPSTLDRPSPRAPIDPNLPPDTPIEPGSRPLGVSAVASPTPSQRIAASEQALSDIPAASHQAVSSSSFIAAARRAAQAAAANAPKAAAAEKPRRAASLLGGKAAPTVAQAPAGSGSKISSRIRSLLVGASVVVIVLSGFKMAMKMLDGPETPTATERPLDPPRERSSDATPAMPAQDPTRVAQPASDLTLPAVTSPVPIERQSSSAPVALPPPSGPDLSPAPKAADVTGSISSPQPSPAPVLNAADRHQPAPTAPKSFTPVSDTLPDGIGGPLLRSAALRGDPSAEFEVAARYSDGRGVPVNYEEAAKWFDRAADAGIVPAMFRLGTMFEKGLGGPKDVDAARRYYIRAAERGNAKAMHNLAVLDADGGGKGPNYKSAAEWFRKAAERGVADSQFNLGILYARGIGVEQNLAESFKWFSLAAAQGDQDAARKRDDVAKRLDPQSLAAAKLAIQTFAPESQPDDAMAVATPAGGWDAAAPTASKPAPKRPARMAAAPPRALTPQTH